MDSQKSQSRLWRQRRGGGLLRGRSYRDKEHSASNNALIEALESSANQFVPTRFSYEEFKNLHGDLIFGGQQPKRALDAIKERLSDDGYFLRTGIQVKKNGAKGNGFMVQRIDSVEPEQIIV